MAKARSSAWRSGIVINLVSSLIAFFVGGTVTYFEHAGSAWVKPMVFGLLAWLLTFTLITVARLGSRIPPKVEVVTDGNIESFVRLWLDRYGQTVRKVPTNDDEFNFLVTTTGNKKITVKRRKDFRDYVTFSALVNITDEERAAFAMLSDDDKARAITDVRLEISRAVMGLSTENIAEQFHLFKELPINRNLLEADFMRTLWEVEAVVEAVLGVNRLTAIRLRSEGKIG